MPNDVAITDNDATDDNPTEEVSNDATDNEVQDSDEGFEDFLKNALGDDLGDDPDSDASDPPDDDSNDASNNDNEDSEEAAPEDEGEVIPVEDVLADDQPNEDETKPNPLEAQVKALMDQNQQLMSMLAQKNADPEPEPEPEVDIFQDDSFNQLGEMLDLDDTGKKALQGFLTKFAEQTQKNSVNQMLQATPDVVGKVMDSKTQIADAKTKFYTENAELAAVKPFVSQLANTIAQENPDMNMAQVLEETSTRAYKVLGLTKKKPEADDKKGKDAPNNSDAGGDKGKKKPAFPKANNTRKPPVKKSKLDGDLDAMLQSLE